jgi:single-strand DNA-binding protein
MVFDDLTIQPFNYLTKNPFGFELFPSLLFSISYFLFPLSFELSALSFLRASLRLPLIYLTICKVICIYHSNSNENDWRWIMAGINKVILIGNLGSDPEVRYTPDGTAVANFNIATSDEWTDKDSRERKKRTEWHRIVAWRRLGEICGEYLSKGRQVYVEGKLQTRSWEKDGVTRYTTEIIASDIQFLGTRNAGDTYKSSESVPSQGYEEPQHSPRQDDDIPF